MHCPKCNTRLLKTFLTQHLLAKHHINPDALGPPRPEFLPSLPIQKYTLDWPSIEPIQPCPAGCEYNAHNPVALHRHFRTRHPQDFIHITREGHPFPKCPNCLLQARNVRDHTHLRSKDCALHTKRRFQREQFVANYLASSHTFSLSDQPLPKVTTYRYLGRLLTSNDSDWPTLYHNLSKARRQWSCIARVLVTEHVQPKAAGMFYKAVVQSILLYCSETWVLEDRMVDTLAAFHHAVAHHLSHLLPYRYRDAWTYPRTSAALDATSLYPIEHYIQVRRNSIAMHIATRPVKRLCETTPPPWATNCVGGPNLT